MKQIQSFILQSSILLLLCFTSVAGDPFSLFITDATESVEVILTESSQENIDDLASCGNLEGSDDDSSTEDISSQPSAIFYPLSIKTGQTCSRPLHKPIPFYILYQRLIFYHPVA